MAPLRLYALPPVALLPQAISRVMLLLVAPLWQNQLWFPWDGSAAISSPSWEEQLDCQVFQRGQKAESALPPQGLLLGPVYSSEGTLRPSVWALATVDLQLLSLKTDLLLALASFKQVGDFSGCILPRVWT